MRVCPQGGEGGRVPWGMEGPSLTFAKSNDLITTARLAASQDAASQPPLPGEPRPRGTKQIWTKGRLGRCPRCRCLLVRRRGV